MEKGVEMKQSYMKWAGQYLEPALRSASSAAVLLLCLASPLTGQAGAGNRAPDLPAICASLAVPEGNKVCFHAYAVGVQIYRWNGGTWVFVAPAAVLYANAEHDGEVGTHYAGPTWESNSGSKVVGQRIAGCTPDATAIPWLLLQAVTAEGPGIFHRVTCVQRVNTVGGVAPAAPGTVIGEEKQVPYTAEYVFYRKTN
jgi:hypothetical protein